MIIQNVWCQIYFRGHWRREDYNRISDIYPPCLSFSRNRGEQRMSAFECFRRVYRSDGLRGFYRGMSASYAGISETVIHFVIYENIKRKLIESKANANMDDEDESVKDASDFVGMMLAAATSKTCATSIAYPHGEFFVIFLSMLIFVSVFFCWLFCNACARAARWIVKRSRSWFKHTRGLIYKWHWFVCVY